MATSIVSPSFFEKHSYELCTEHGQIVGYFASFKCAAFSAVLRGEPGKPTRYTVHDRKESWHFTYLDCVRVYIEAITPKGQPKDDSLLMLQNRLETEVK